MKVFIAVHDRAPTPSARYLTRVQVGAALGERQTGCVHDDDGDNISARNPLYAELTALYWLWKNVEDDVVGLCHYRRYFSPIMAPSEPVLTARRDDVQGLVSLDPAGVLFAQETAIAELIVPRPVVCTGSLEDQYISHHGRPQDWHAMLAALALVHPNEARDARGFFTQSNALTQYNMLIGRRDVVRAYCAWLFPVLAEVERVLNPQVHPMQHRALGFLGERLFSWWLESRNPRRVHRPVLFINE
ncbi:MAG TPA: DUF4422 domain-containing protein [Acetobacteraceae bacterium]|jgi:hypothetical protein|nr:DUF4422 domain-containing protein [Acetobacteraceae bacterium]